MSLIVKTSNPAKLLREIKAAIDAQAVRTWKYNAFGHFTHAARQWKDQAWLKPIIAKDSLTFDVILPAEDVKPGVDGIYLGRFSSMLFNHFNYSAVVGTTNDLEANGGAVKDPQEWFQGDEKAQQQMMGTQR